MKSIEYTMTYRWWRDDRKDISSEHIEELNDHAKDRITEQWAKGYLAGELCETLYLEHSHKPVEYSGWWDLKQNDDA